MYEIGLKNKEFQWKKKNLICIIIATIILILGFAGFDIYQMLSYKVEPEVVVLQK